MTTEQKLNQIAENSLLKVISRFGLILVLPIATWFATSTFKDIRSVHDDALYIRTALEQGLIPRIEYMEQEVGDIRVELRTRTTDNFSKADADKLENRIQERLSRLERQLDEMKNQLSKRG